MVLSAHFVQGAIRDRPCPRRLIVPLEKATPTNYFSMKRNKRRTKWPRPEKSRSPLVFPTVRARPHFRDQRRTCNQARRTCQMLTNPPNPSPCMCLVSCFSFLYFPLLFWFVSRVFFLLPFYVLLLSCFSFLVPCFLRPSVFPAWYFLFLACNWFRHR